MSDNRIYELCMNNPEGKAAYNHYAKLELQRDPMASDEEITAAWKRVLRIVKRILNNIYYLNSETGEVTWDPEQCRTWTREGVRVEVWKNNRMCIAYLM